MIVKSLKSQGYLIDVFNWQWSYYTVTNKGVNFLVKALGVPTDVVPATYKKKKVSAIAAPKTEEGDEKPVEGEETPAGLGRAQ